MNFMVGKDWMDVVVVTETNHKASKQTNKHIKNQSNKRQHTTEKSTATTNLHYGKSDILHNRIHTQKGVETIKQQNNDLPTYNRVHCSYSSSGNISSLLR